MHGLGCVPAHLICDESSICDRSSETATMCYILMHLSIHLSLSLLLSLHPSIFPHPGHVKRPWPMTAIPQSAREEHSCYVSEWCEHGTEPGHMTYSLLQMRKTKNCSSSCRLLVWFTYTHPYSVTISYAVSEPAFPRTWCSGSCSPPNYISLKKVCVLYLTQRLASSTC